MAWGHLTDPEAPRLPSVGLQTVMGGPSWLLLIGTHGSGPHLPQPPPQGPELDLAWPRELSPRALGSHLPNEMKTPGGWLGWPLGDGQREGVGCVFCGLAVSWGCAGWWSRARPHPRRWRVLRSRLSGQERTVYVRGVGRAAPCARMSLGGRRRRVCRAGCLCHSRQGLLGAEASGTPGDGSVVWITGKHA